MVLLMSGVFLGGENIKADSREFEKAPFVQVPPCAKPPVIDGILSQGEWDCAFMGTGVTSQPRTEINRKLWGGLDPVKVQYWFTYDTERIYIAARMETDPNEIYDRLPRKLAGGGTGGHFEIMVDPSSCNPDANWQTAMLYPLGVLKNLGRSQRIGKYFNYEVNWDYKDSWQNGFWTVEISAPIREFTDASLKNGSVWGMLCGGRIETGPYYFMGPLGSPYNFRKDYVKMMLNSQSPIIQLEDMGDVSTGTITPKLKITNNTGKELDLKVFFTYKSSLGDDAKVLNQKEQSIKVGNGKSETFTWTVPPPEKEGFKILNYLFMKIISSDGKIRYYDMIYAIQSPRKPKWVSTSKISSEPIIIETYLFPYFSSVNCIVDFGGLDKPESVSEAKIKIAGPNGKIIKEEQVNSFENNAIDTTIQLPGNLAEGTYKVNCLLLDGQGKEIGKINDTFGKNNFAFENNNIGKSDKVLYPWTPIKVNKEKRQINVWERTYALAESAFPESIITKGEQILASPVQLIEKSNGKEIPLKGISFNFTKIADHEVNAVAELSGDVLRAQVRLHAEYDGMLKYEIELTGPTDAKVDGLDLVISVKPEFSEFLHATGDGCRCNYSHALPKRMGKIWDPSKVTNWMMPACHVSYMWLGDYDRGLCWWTDSTKGWTLPLNKTEPVEEIFRENGKVRTVIHIITHKTSPLWRGNEPRKLIFALEATPVKESPSWGRDVVSVDVAVPGLKGPFIKWFGSTWWAFPNCKSEEMEGGRYAFGHIRCISPESEKALKELTDEYHKKDYKTLAYTDIRVRSMVGKEAKEYAFEWSPDKELPRQSVIKAKPYYDQIGVSATPSRIDYDLWCMKKLMDLGIDFWYFDEIDNRGQINPAANLGYQDEEGRWIPEGRLFAYRELWKRLYTMMQLDYGQKEPLIMLHNTSTTWGGPMAFASILLDFELNNADPTKRHLTQYGMDFLITETMGKQYGLASTCLGVGAHFEGWLDKYPEEKSAIQRHWIGIHMLLDMAPCLYSYTEVKNGIKIMADFGRNQPDCEWIPYWKAKKEKLYSYAPEDGIYVSSYKRPGKILLVFLNDTEKDQMVTWNPLPKLGISLNSYKIFVPKFNYQTLEIKSRNDK
jgi:hypothetical protein